MIVVSLRFLLYFIFVRLIAMRTLLLLILSIFISVINFQACAQDSLIQTKRYPTHQFSGALQVWLRHTDTNPGTLVNSQPVTSLTDISVRRLRLKISGDLSSKLKYTIQVGENNINYLTGKEIRLRILDAYTEYQINETIFIGAGKSAWTGIARGSTPSTQKLLGLDLSTLATPTLNTEDDFLRTLGLFVRGCTKRLNYRFNISNPFSSDTKPTGPDPVFAPKPGSLQLAGYTSVNLLEAESFSNAFYPGTYLGTKRVLSVGGGFMYQANALQRLENEQIQYLPMKHLAFDLFYETPVNTGAFTLYAAAFAYDFGNGYVRNIGVNNTGNGVSAEASFNGTGNNFPVLGTGHAFLGQVGYLLPSKNKQKSVRYQFYSGLNHASYQKLDDKMILIEGGLNILLNGHQSKFTLGYQNRPIYNLNNNDKLVTTDRKNMWVLQYQIILN